MEKNDPRSRRLLELVRDRIRQSGRSHRELERELDLGHGTLGNIFRGRTELRLRHVAMLGRVLGFEPGDLLNEAYRISPPEPPLPPGFPVSREELRGLIVEALREELDRRGMAVSEGVEGVEEGQESQETS
jgi:transcriptional regulator with XRE-family HTH domain